jgi:hypothetical protein
LFSWVRSRLTYANVVATLALFLVLGGGTALASYIVSSNTQIGPGTVSGHKPPSGDHSNVIAGSVNGTDLAGSSVNSGKVVDGSLLGSDIHANTITGSNLNTSSVAGALQVRTAYTADGPGAPPEDFYTQGPWTLTGTCVDEGGGFFHAKVDLTNSGDAAMVAVNDGSGNRVSSGGSTTVAQSGSVQSGNLGTASKGGEFSAVLANTTFNNHISGHVLAVADGGQQDYTNMTGFCKFAFEGLGS